MSYKMHANASLEALIDYCAGVIAGLQALDARGKLAAPWIDRRAQLKAERESRDADRFEVLCATAVVKMCDARFDHAIVELSGLAFLAAGKKAGAEPYASLFGTTKAAEAKALGPDAAVEFADGLLQKANAQNVAMLLPALHTLAEASGELGQSGQARTAASQKSQVHEVVRKQSSDATEALIATTEAAMLAQWPGRDDLVRAALAPER